MTEQSYTYTLLLLDVDGVLVHPVGYKTALRATVDFFTELAGLPAWGPSFDEIAVFESCGMTNEWSSAGVCSAAILLAALEARPDLRRDTLAATLAAIRAAQLTLDRPDFVTIARQIRDRDSVNHFPASIYLTLLSEYTDPANVPLLTDLLRNVYDVLGTLTTRIFQAYTLGDTRYVATYGIPAPLASESYLTTQDSALLNPANQARLVAWSRDPAHGTAIFTARPSLPPRDVPESVPTVPTASNLAGYAPEAELAADLLDMNGHVPLIGQGRVGWLAAQHGRGTADYIKPSPVQALAGIGAALAGSETAALLAAAAAVEHGTLTGPLAQLRDATTRVFVFEDSTGGIRATRSAVALLCDLGLDVQSVAVGISPNSDKRAALRAVADHVVDDVNAGLALVWN